MYYEIKDFGDDYHEIIIHNQQWLIAFSDLGARINRWQAGDKQLILANRDAQEALSNQALYLGATVGRVAGRLAGASVDLGGKTYSLRQNEGIHHLHGGAHPLDLARWTFEVVEEGEAITVVFKLKDADLNNGYPGNMSLQVSHRYSKDNRWTIHYQAESDQNTLFNPTNHVYFNLTGDPSQAIDNHLIKIHSNKYLPLQADGIPKGYLESVSDLGMESGHKMTFGQIFAANRPQIQLKSGLDHAFVLEAQDPQVEVFEEVGSYSLQMGTDQECIVIYTVNDSKMNAPVNGQRLTYHGAFTLEAQALPDAIHWQDKDATVLKANTVYQSQTWYQIFQEEESNGD